MAPRGLRVESLPLPHEGPNPGIPRLWDPGFYASCCVPERARKLRGGMLRLPLFRRAISPRLFQILRELIQTDRGRSANSVVSIMSL